MSTTEVDELNMSQLSLNSNGSQTSEDWDRSLMLDDSIPPTPSEDSQQPLLATTTPRNSVIFPATNGVGVDSTPKSASGGGGRSKRSLSELLRLHAEKGTDCHFSTEEAARVADVLGQWINTGSSPYEDEDDFFNRSQDDLSLPSRRSPMPEGRARGQSESGGGGSRPPSSAGTRS